MKHKLYLIFPLIFLMGCSQKQSLIPNQKMKNEIEAQLQVQKKIAERRSDILFNVLDTIQSVQEKEALEFLYAYMPLSDLADYDGQFFVQQVQYALLARKTFHWGNKVPNDIFLHFVLPYRINNENPDTARAVFYKELKDRIKNLSMKEAALEVNHWCHEKVSYHPSDIRTSAPLSTVKNALGRCGEESTFTVTAMRAVGIPARQIYTPRWAHSDDNHAWVEVWVDGKWYFLGACEPNPDLNMGWFAEPATRAMLLHTKVFGHYSTNDDIVNQDQRYTEINILPSYAPSKRVYVQVLNSKGAPVNNALVQFKLYNYAEFYPIAKAYTHSNGICSLLTGFGDLIAWASKDGLFDYKKLRVANTDTLKLILHENKQEGMVDNYTLVPPTKGKVVEVSDSLIQLNNLRLKYEDSLRFAYEKTFIDSLSSVALAQSLNLDPKDIWKVLHKSRGNWEAIVTFLKQVPLQFKQQALDLLLAISEKDLHDTPVPVLMDHLLNSKKENSINKDLFTQYVLNSHISNELQSAYKKTIQDYFGENFIKETREDIHVLVQWINDSITITSKANAWRTPIRPKGVLSIRHADSHSRNIFFVAACRSFGIPSRLEASRSIPQIYRNHKWIDVSFEAVKVENLAKGTITLEYNGELLGLQPEYYIHFTLGRFNGSSYQTLDYEYSDAFKTYPATLSVDTGRYVLITGKRLQDGTVLSKVKYFTLHAGEQIEQRLEFNQPTDTASIIGKVELDQEILPLPHKEAIHNVSLKKLANNAGLVMMWIDPDKEPTKHLINDLYKLKANFGIWPGAFVFLIPEEKYSNEFDPNKYQDLPKGSLFTIDKENLLKSIDLKKQEKSLPKYPFVVVTNNNGEVLYTSEGYKIGCGEQILNTINTRCTIHYN